MLEKNWLTTIAKKLENSSLHKTLEISSRQVTNKLSKYENINKILISYELLLVPLFNKHSFKNLKNFNFLKENIVDLKTKFRIMITQIQSKKLKPTIYFSKSLKELCKYTRKKSQNLSR